MSSDDLLALYSQGYDNALQMPARNAQNRTENHRPKHPNKNRKANQSRRTPQTPETKNRRRNRPKPKPTPQTPETQTEKAKANVKRWPAAPKGDESSAGLKEQEPIFHNFPAHVWQGKIDLYIMLG